VTLLIDAGANVNECNFDNESALYRAITTFHYNGIIVEKLLDARADVNVKGGEYGFPLQAAAFQGNEEIVKLLVEEGAKVNAQGGKYGTALQAAASIGETAIVKYLLGKGANVNAQSGLFGSPVEAALANCARHGLGITNHLLDVGAR
jgi:ankyrin repeat protein